MKFSPSLSRTTPLLLSVWSKDDRFHIDEYPASDISRRASRSEWIPFLFHDLEAWLNDSEYFSSYLGELVGEPSENGYGTEGDNANVEVAAKLVGLSVGNAAQDRIAMHLSKDPDEPGANDEE